MITFNCLGSIFKFPASELPQDGARIISYIEKKSEEMLSNSFAKYFYELATSKKVILDFVKGYNRHVAKTGKRPDQVHWFWNFLSESPNGFREKYRMTPFLVYEDRLTGEIFGLNENDGKMYSMIRRIK